MSGPCVEGLVWLGRVDTAPRSTLAKMVPPQKDCLVTMSIRVPERPSSLMMSHHATFHNHLEGSTAGLSDNDEYQGAREAQLPDDESPRHVPQSPRWFHHRIVW